MLGELVGLKEIVGDEEGASELGAFVLGMLGARLGEPVVVG